MTQSPRQGFTSEQVSALSAPLDRSHVKSRSASGRELSYIEGWHAIAEANRIFGFGTWLRETVDCRCVVDAERPVGRNGDSGWGVTYTARVRITIFSEFTIIREGTGAGHGIDRDRGLAHESAIKEAETDAMKRALMTFGNPFGLALYDKQQREVEGASAGRRGTTPPAPREPSVSSAPTSPVPAAARPGERPARPAPPSRPPARPPATPARPAPPSRPAAAPTGSLLGQAIGICRAAGLTDEGLAAFASRLTGGTSEDLGQVPVETLQRLVKDGPRGISRETIATCNNQDTPVWVSPSNQP